MTIIKFPHNVARRAHARLPRTSKYGTPEERAAKEAAIAAMEGATRLEIAAAAKRRTDWRPPALAALVTPEKRRRAQMEDLADDFQLLTEMQCDAVLEFVSFMARQNGRGQS